MTKFQQICVEKKARWLGDKTRKLFDLKSNLEALKNLEENLEHPVLKSFKDAPMWLMSRAQLETNRCETDVLLEILRPVMEFLEDIDTREYESDYDSQDSNEADPLQAHIEVLQATDNALIKSYTTVDPVLEAREEAITHIDTSPYPNTMHEPINNYKALHVLTRIQETWLVKFSAMVSSHDTWGRAFLHELRGFGDELQNLTSFVRTWVTDPPPPSIGIEEIVVRLATQCELTARKFYCVLLFLFDVGLTLEAAAASRQVFAVLLSPAFSSRSDVRSRVLAHAGFITHLETCAWKVMLMHPSIRNTYRQLRAADYDLSRRVYRKIRDVRSDCYRRLDRLHADGTGPRLAVRLALVATEQAAHGLPAAAVCDAGDRVLNATHAKLRQLLALLKE